MKSLLRIVCLSILWLGIPSIGFGQVSTSNISNLPDGQQIGGSTNSSIILRPGKGAGETLSIAGWDVDGNVIGTATSGIVLTSGNTPVVAITNPTISGGQISGIIDLAVADGGTGASDASGARTNLGLVIGTNIQAYDSDLTTYAGITPSPNMQTFLAAANYGAMRTQLTLVPGTDVQAYDAELLQIASLADPNADRLLFWDDSAGQWKHLTLGTNLSITDTTLNASGGGGDVDAFAADPTTNGNFDPDAWKSGLQLGELFYRYNIVDYGATPNDSSDDDSDDIQEAVDAAKLAGGGVVYVPPGEFNVANGVVIDEANVCLQGADSTSVIEAKSGSWSTYEAIFHFNGVDTGLGNRYSWIRDLRIDGNRIAPVGLHLQNLVEWNVIGIDITGCTRVGRYEDGIQNVTFLGNRTQRNGSGTLKGSIANTPDTGSEAYGYGLGAVNPPFDDANVIVDHGAANNHHFFDQISEEFPTPVDEQAVYNLIICQSSESTIIDGAEPHSNVWHGGQIERLHSDAKGSVLQSAGRLNKFDKVVFYCPGANTVATVTRQADTGPSATTLASNSLSLTNCTFTGDGDNNGWVIEALTTSGNAVFVSSPFVENIDNFAQVADATNVLVDGFRSGTEFTTYVTNATDWEGTPGTDSVASLVQGPGVLKLNTEPSGSVYTQNNWTTQYYDATNHAWANYDDSAWHFAYSNTPTLPGHTVSSGNTSITLEAADNQVQRVTVSDSSAWTLNAPTNPLVGRLLVVDILNSSGGAMGTVTFNGVFVLETSWSAPANGSRVILFFVYDGTNWRETDRTPAPYQPLDSDLTIYAGITPSANIQTLLGSADNSAARTNLGLAIGTNVQAYDADLTTYSGITPSANVQSFLGAADYSAMRTQLGLVIGTNVQAYDTDLTTWAGITPGTGVGTALAINVGTSGSFVAMNGALGTPSSGTLTNCTGLPGTSVVFADTDNVWTATNVQAALEELNDSINSGTPNGTGAKVHWSQLLGVPAGFADGTDDGAGGGSGTLTTIEVGDSAIDNDIVVLDFAAADFDDAGESPENEANITIDASITRDSEVNGYFADPSTNGSFNASNWRSDLGLVIGTNVQAQDTELSAIAGLTSAADKGIQFTGAGTAGTFDLTAAGKALLDDADTIDQRITLGLVIDEDIQGFNEGLQQLGGIFTSVPGDNFLIYYDSSLVSYAVVDFGAGGDLVWSGDSINVSIDNTFVPQTGSTIDIGSSSVDWLNIYLHDRIYLWDTDDENYGQIDYDSSQYRFFDADGTTYANLRAADITGVNASFSSLALTTDLSVSNGGTGASTLTGLLQGNGTSAFTAITNSTTVGQTLRVTGSNTYGWGALDLADTDAVTGVLPAGNHPAASTSASGINEHATAAEINTGSSGSLAINPTEYRQSIYGQIPVTVTLGTDLVAMTTGDGKAYFLVPPKLNGMNLVSIAGALHTGSSSGTPTFQVRRYRASGPTTVDMLSTAITFDASSETLLSDSSTSAGDGSTGYQINTSNDDVLTDDIIYIDCDTAGTGTKAPQFWLFFQIP